MLTDIEIAQSCVMQPIEKIADTLGLTPDLLEPYGRYKAKVDYLALKDRPQKGRLVLVTAINPTPAGEGKTTVSIGLADALRLEGYNACLALREPSLGPVFGVKGGAAGGGYAQVVPMEDINLHFTGDMHAITAANNLIAAMVDNSIQQGNPCNIDPRRVTVSCAIFSTVWAASPTARRAKMGLTSRRPAKSWRRFVSLPPLRISRRASPALSSPAPMTTSP